MTVKRKKMKNKKIFVTYGYIATVIIGTAISEIQLMQYGYSGSETVGCVKNYKTRTALDCMRTINEVTGLNKQWRIL